jgi:chromosomal replication initiator protein
MHPDVKKELQQCQANIEAILGRAVVLDMMEMDLSDDEKLVRKVTDLRDLKAAVCFNCNVTWPEVQGPLRVRRYAVARFIFCLFARHKIKMTLSEIGEQIGGRDHTSVIHALAKIQDLIDIKDDYVYPRYMAVKLQLLPQYEIEANPVGV